MENTENKKIKARVFHIVQRIKDEKTGEDLLTKNKIIQALGHKSIKQWAFILHDKDKNSEGKLKSSHWHIVLSCPNQVEIDKIGEWFNVPTNFIEMPKGRDAFEDCVAYLTHEECKDEKKFRYERNLIESSFDINVFFEEREKDFREKLLYGRNLNDSERMMMNVLKNGKTLRECDEENGLIYAKNIDKLKKLRSEYLSKQSPPALRINIYVCGEGGVGKDLMSRAIARSFFPQYKYDDEIFFHVGARGSAFEGYDGQPVIIWSDRRAIDLITEFNNRGNVFNIFDSHPTKVKQNIKYSSISLVNSVNIINSVQPYEEFLNGLAGEYISKEGTRIESEDKKQSYRRFPIILKLDVSAYDLLVNEGVMYGNKAFLQYEMQGRFQQGLQKLAEKCKDMKMKREIEIQTVKPVIDVKEEIERNDEELSNEEIREMFKNSGKRIDINNDGFEEVGDVDIPFD